MLVKPKLFLQPLKKFKLYIKYIPYLSQCIKINILKYIGTYCFFVKQIIFVFLYFILLYIKKSDNYHDKSVNDEVFIEDIILKKFSFSI